MVATGGPAETTVTQRFVSDTLLAANAHLAEHPDPSAAPGLADIGTISLLPAHARHGLTAPADSTACRAHGVSALRYATLTQVDSLDIWAPLFELALRLNCPELIADVTTVLLEPMREWNEGNVPVMYVSFSATRAGSGCKAWALAKFKDNPYGTGHKEVSLAAVLRSSCMSPADVSPYYNLPRCLAQEACLACDVSLSICLRTCSSQL